MSYMSETLSCFSSSVVHRHQVSRKPPAPMPQMIPAHIPSSVQGMEPPSLQHSPFESHSNEPQGTPSALAHFSVKGRYSASSPMRKTSSHRLRCSFFWRGVKTGSRPFRHPQQASHFPSPTHQRIPLVPAPTPRHGSVKQQHIHIPIVSVSFGRSLGIGQISLSLTLCLSLSLSLYLYLYLSVCLSLSVCL